MNGDKWIDGGEKLDFGASQFRASIIKWERGQSSCTRSLSFLSHQSQRQLTQSLSRECLIQKSWTWLYLQWWSHQVYSLPIFVCVCVYMQIVERESSKATTLRQVSLTLMMIVEPDLMGHWLTLMEVMFKWSTGLHMLYCKAMSARHAGSRSTMKAKVLIFVDAIMMISFTLMITLLPSC